MALIFTAREVEAVVIAATVAAFTFALSEDDAFNMLVFAVATLVLTVASVAPREVDARSVWALIADVIPEVWVLVLLLTVAAILVAREDDALPTVVVVLVLIDEIALAT